MATQSQQLYCYSESSSTPTNFNTWAGWMSSCLANAGWLQTTDSGQAMWNALTISVVANVSGNTWRYTYATAAGNRTLGANGNGTNGLYVGQVLTTAALTNSGNNGTFSIVAVTATTFDVVNAAGQAESGSSGTVTVNATAPTAGANTYPIAATLYETWTPGDGGTFAYVVKIYYGLWSSNFPGIWVAIGTGTDGAGNLTGNISIAQALNGSGGTASNANKSMCYFSGDTSRFGFSMWNANLNFTTAYTTILIVERSHDSNGNDTQQYAQIWSAGYSGSKHVQVVYPLGLGTTSIFDNSWASMVPAEATSFGYSGSWGVSNFYSMTAGATNPLIGAVGVISADYANADQSTLQSSVYGITHTYLVFIVNYTPSVNTNLTTIRCAMRFD